MINSNPQPEFISRVTKFILGAESITSMYERIGLMAETIGWLLMFNVYEESSSKRLHDAMEKYIQTEIDIGMNKELITALNTINKLNNYKLLVHITPFIKNNDYGRLFTNILEKFYYINDEPFWNNTELCWLIRDYQVSEKTEDRSSTLLSAMASFSDNIVIKTNADIMYLAGYTSSVISNPVNEPLPDFTSLNCNSHVNMGQLQKMVGNKNIIILTSESIFDTFGVNNMAEFIANDLSKLSLGVVIVWEIPGVNRIIKGFDKFNFSNDKKYSGDLFTKYGFDMYHFRTSSEELIKIFISDPGYLLYNINRL